MRSVGYFLLLGGLTLVADDALGYHLQSPDSIHVKIEVSDEAVAVCFSSSVDSTTLQSFVANRPYLNSRAAAIPVGDGFYQLSLREDTSALDAITALRSESNVSMVNPVFKGPTGLITMAARAIVKFRNEVGQNSRDSLHEVLGSTVLPFGSSNPNFCLIRARMDAHRSLLDILDEYLATGLCDYAAPSFRAKAILHSDPLWSKQWHFENTGQENGTPGADIDAAKAREITTGDSNVTIAIIDGGFRWLDHPDLGPGCLISGWDSYGDSYGSVVAVPDSDYSPSCHGAGAECYHGTAILGELAARPDNDTGIAGLAPSCRYFLIKAFAYDTTVTEALTNALHLAWTPPVSARVVSCSWSWPFDGDSNSIGDEIDTMLSHGVAVFFSSGNWGLSDYIFFPNRLAYSVGATDNDDSIWEYTDRGPDLDLVAPGGGGWNPPQVWTTDLPGTDGANNDYGDCGDSTMDYNCIHWGTSSAAPLAAGSAALILSVRPEFMETEDSLLFKILSRSAEDLGPSGRDDTYGNGRVNAFQALLSVARGNTNGDKMYDLADVVEVDNQRSPSWTPKIHKGLCDLNCDGTVDTVDVRMAADIVFRDVDPPDMCFTFDY